MSSHPESTPIMEPQLPYKPETRFAFVHEGTISDWSQYLFTTAQSARAFGGQWKGRVVKVEITAVEVGPEVGSLSPTI